MTEGIMLAVGTALSGWASRLEAKGWKLEAKVAATEVRLDGFEKLSDERHQDQVARLVRLETKLDSLLDR